MYWLSYSYYLTLNSLAVCILMLMQQCTVTHMHCMCEVLFTEIVAAISSYLYPLLGP